MNTAKSKLKLMVISSAFALSLIPLARGAGSAGDMLPPLFPPGIMMPHHSAGAIPAHLHHLDLSDEQRDMLFEIVIDQARAMHSAMKRVHERESELDSLSRAEQFNAAEVEQASKAFGQSVAALAKLRTEQQQRIYTILTAEQREKFKQRKDKHGPAGMRPRHFAPPHCDNQDAKRPHFPQRSGKIERGMFSPAKVKSM